MKNGIIHKAVCTQKCINKIRHNDDRYHVWKANRRLDKFCNLHLPDLRHHNCNGKRKYQSSENKYQIVAQSITDHDRSIFCLKQVFKVFKPHPGTTPNSFGVVQIFKGNRDSIHRKIVIDDQINHSRKKHQKQWNIIHSFLFSFFRSCFLHNTIPLRLSLSYLFLPGIQLCLNLCNKVIHTCVFHLFLHLRNILFRVQFTGK